MQLKETDEKIVHIFTVDQYIPAEHRNGATEAIACAIRHAQPNAMVLLLTGGIRPALSLESDDLKHLQWVYDRLTEVYGEDPRLDYMRKFKSIIEGVAQ